ncbi:MAG TPA: glycosyltransferase family 4 protein [Candidatus Saccharimonadales bacterium]|nr:glycosyltransferase family 4 protein [Candidatus Saccharimonadales bacterium]
MKIGLVCPYNVSKGGGVQECVFALQSELSARGHETLILTPQPREHNGTIPGFVRPLGRSADVKSPFHTTAQVSVSVDTSEVDALLEKEKFEVLHFHEPWVPLLSWQLLQRSRARNIATFHAKLPDTVMSRTIERVITPYTKSVLKYLHALTAVSDPAAMYVNSLTDREVQIIPNGIDLEKYRTRGRNQEKKMIFYIGRLERRKGLKYLLRAVRSLQMTEPQVELVIAGNGPDKMALERYADELGVKNVRFPGQIDEATKMKLLKAATVFCSPARYGESFGVVLLEAMAAGVPVVAGDNAGYMTVLTQTGRISLVDPRNIKEFTRRLDLLMNDQALRQAWQDWASRTVGQYSYKQVVDQYETLYGKA